VTLKQQDTLDPTPLDTRVVGARVLVHESVASTNDEAFRIGGDGSVVVADAQSAGRGRQGHQWHSAPGQGIWVSVVFEGHVSGLTVAAALAVRDALASYGAPAIKWPNDLLLNGKKICGILVEHRAGLTVVGIGINVHHRFEDFPEDLRSTATSLTLETGGTLQRSDCLRAVLTELDVRVVQLREDGFEPLRREWALACDLLQRRIQFGEEDGTVVGFDDDGALLVATDDAMHCVRSGPFTVLRDT
jgi:BirA family biotin operon repressor/biotin-[acetyl-CoA-carboxylase] ligase